MCLSTDRWLLDMQEVFFHHRRQRHRHLTQRSSGSALEPAPAGVPQQQQQQQQQQLLQLSQQQPSHDGLQSAWRPGAAAVGGRQAARPEPPSQLPWQGALACEEADEWRAEEDECGDGAWGEEEEEEEEEGGEAGTFARPTSTAPRFDDTW
jgi:hypothetical protein